MIPATFKPGAYATRPFTLEQRLLTEPRLLFDYLHWTLLPTITQLGFYHDDISTSAGWLQPPQTALALGGIIVLLFVAASRWMRRRMALTALGILWFFAAHVLTATFIPLELVYEHRNYFASIGALIAVAGVVEILPRYQPGWIGIGTFSLVLVYAGLCFARAEDWSDPMRFANSEAVHHPCLPVPSMNLGGP